MKARTYRTLGEFYPYYLTEHRNTTCRVLHFIGTGTALLTLLAAVVTTTWWLLPVALVLGYGPAWVGHFFFERNRPATFTYPLFSLVSDFRLFFEILLGRQGFRADRGQGAAAP